MGGRSMRGRALCRRNSVARRSWSNRPDEYNLSWGEWKANLRRAFPRHHDYVDLLAEMLARIKMADETMTHYYHDKMAILERCELGGEKALSCLIEGLPMKLQGNTRAFRHTGAGELYAGFLSSFDKYQAGAESKRRSSGSTPSTIKVRRPGGTRAEQLRGETARETTSCYNCQELETHFSRDCPKPRAKRYMRCGEADHDRYHCRSDRRPDGPMATATTSGGRPPK